MSEFHFLRPECIFLILPLAVLFFYKQIRPLKAGNWQNVISPQLQQYVLFQKGKETNSKVISGALWLAALLGVLALAGPSWEKQQSAVYRSSHGLVIGLDLSLSMTAQDVTPSRIQRAKYKIIDLIEQQKDKSIALIAYSGDAHVVSPLTKDIATIKSMMTALDPYIMPKPGSNLVNLAKQTVELFEQSNNNPRTLILVTDGVESSDIDEATALLSAANIDLNILAVGTDEGAPMMRPDGRFIKDSNGQVILPPLEWDNLVELADESNGNIERLTNTEQDIQRIMTKIAQSTEFEKQEDENVTFDQWLDSGYWLILPLLLLTLGAFRKGVVLSVALLILAQSNESYANQIPDVLLNSDQVGAKYFAQDPAKAAEHFKDKQWKASSLYKSGDYQGALDIWQQFDDAQSLYNKGNALAQLQKFDEAITAYDGALEKQPDLKDAEQNKQLLEQMMQNQPQDQQNQQDQDGQQGDQNQQQDGEQTQSDASEQSQQEAQQSQQQDANQSESGKQEDQQQASQSQDGEQQDSKNPLSQEQSKEEKELEEELAELKKQLQEESDQQKEESGEQSMTQSQPTQDAKTLEQQQSMQQWMQRIPDDPSGLLRNKFLYQYQQRQGQQQEQNEERKPW